MGVVKRQGIKQSLVTYFGMSIGALSLFFIYPYSLSTEEIGIIQFVIRASTFFMPFALLGAQMVAINHFPVFKNEQNGHNGFLSVIGLMSAASVLFLILVILIFKKQIGEYYAGRSDYFIRYLPYILPLIVLMSFSYLLTVYTSNFHRIVIPSIFFNLLNKVALPALALAYFWKVLSFTGIFNGVLLTYVITLLGLIWYLWHLGQFSLRINRSFLQPALMRSISVYYWYNALFGIGVTILTQVDAIFVGSMLNLSSVAVYSIGFFLAEAIDTPRKALLTVTGPLIAESVTNQDFAHVKELYQKTSLNQLIAGLFLLIGIWVCCDDLFLLMPKGAEFASGKWVILILGLGRVIEMTAGSNYEIINYSKYYRFNFYSVLILAAFTLLSSYWMIHWFNIYGAALATMTSVFLFNFVKLIFIRSKFKIQPLTWGTLKVILIGVVSYLLASYIPAFHHPILSILQRGLIVSIFYIGGILWSGVSEDINALVVQLWGVVRKGKSRSAS